MQHATANWITFSRGVRGILGVRWLSPEMATPEPSQLLASVDPAATGSLIAAIVAARDAEVQRQGGSDEARMFSQHREGRHSGHSGIGG